MKQIKDISEIIFGCYLMLMSTSFNFMLLGLGIFFNVHFIFKLKKYDNPRLFMGVASLILVVSLTLAYFQLSSPTFAGNRLVNYIVAIGSILAFIIVTCDFTHEDSILSKNIQMGDLSHLGKIILITGLLISGLIVAMLMNLFIFKI